MQQDLSDPLGAALIQNLSLSKAIPPWHKLRKARLLVRSVLTDFQCVVADLRHSGKQDTAQAHYRLYRSSGSFLQHPERASAEPPKNLAGKRARGV